MSVSAVATTNSSCNALNNALNEEQDKCYSSNSVNINSRRAQWDSMFDELKEYKSTHGDTLVPATYLENPSLGYWVDRQRQLYRMRLEADEGYDNQMITITDEKIERLDSIDFVWSVYEHTWNARYEELKAYVNENGNALVPWKYPQNEQLGLWVMTQRRIYKLMQQGEQKGDELTDRSDVIDDRIQKLNEIGFVWDLHEAQFLERLEELKVYRMNNGDTLVPKQYSAQPLLGGWINKQRQDYKRYMAKKKIEEEWRGKSVLDEKVQKEMERLNSRSTGMTEERIRLLEAEDFVWDPKALVWEEKFAELCDFVALNGHAAVFRKGGAPYNPLARWAESQRTNYRKYKNGQKTTLTEERIERLDAINFVWTRRKTNRTPARKQMKIQSEAK